MRTERLPKKNALLMIAILVGSVMVLPLYRISPAAAQTTSLYFYVPNTNPKIQAGNTTVQFITGTTYDFVTGSFNFDTYNLILRTSGDQSNLTIGYSKLPSGATFDQKSKTLTWPGGEIKKYMQHSASPAFLGITFNATRDQEHASLFVQLAVENSRSLATINFDKLSYYAGGDVATITVKDFHARKNVTGLNTVDVKVKSFGLVPSSSDNPSPLKLPVPFSESKTIRLYEVKDDPDVGPGTFRGHLSLTDYTSNPSKDTLRVPTDGLITASYDMSDSKLPLQAITTAIVRTVSIDVGFGGHIMIGDTSTITIKDREAKSDNSANEYSLLAVSPSATVSTKIKENGSSTGLLKGTLSFFESSPIFGFNASDFLKTKVGDEVVFHYKGIIETAKVAPKVSVSFDKTSYQPGAVAAVTVTDIHQNNDKWKQDRLNVTLTSGADKTGFNVILMEEGINSGVFHGIGYIYFNKTSNPWSQTIAINEPKDTITASYTYTTGDKVATESKTANVINVNWTRDLPGSAGIGETGGNPTSWGSITIANSVINLSCDDYGRDDDQDGICNQWETDGILSIPYNGHTYDFDYVCDPYCLNSGNKDILLEVDYISERPDPTVMSDIKTIYGNKGYQLHYDVNEDVGPIPTLATDPPEQAITLNVWKDPSSDNTTPGDSYKEIKQSKFGHNANERYGTDQGKALRQVYHYMIFGKNIKQQYDPGSSGYAETIGNDIIVTLGSFTGVDAYNNKQKGTIMHEFGHNLGLNHGGGGTANPDNTVTWIDDYKINCKPNYLSSMSYIRQFPNVANLYSTDLQGWDALYSTNSVTHVSGSDSSLNNNRLNEGDGLKTTSSNVEIAWGVNATIVNADGSTTLIRTFKTMPISSSYTSSTADDIDLNGNNWTPDTNVKLSKGYRLVNLGFGGCDQANSNKVPNTGSGSLISDHDDWNHLILNFRAYGNGTGDSGLSFGEPDYAELNSTTWKQILGQSIVSLNNEIQILGNSSFEDSMHEGHAFTELLVNGRGSVYSYIQSDDMAGAVNKLSTVRDDVDALIVDGIAKDNILKLLDTNALVLSQEIPQGGDTFTLTTTYNGTTYVIIGNSTTVKPSNNTFTIEPGVSLKDIKLTGSGDVTLKLQHDLVRAGGILDDHTAIVTVDGTNTTFSPAESSNGYLNQTITFSIPSAGDHDVKIASSLIVPEFPLASALILAISLLAAVGVMTLARRHNGGLF